MDNNDFASMSFDELWDLYEKLTAKLAHEVGVEKAKLEELLRKIESSPAATDATTTDATGRIQAGLGS
jgi:hypothetical protein